MVQIKAKYLAILEVIQMVGECFGVEVGQINCTPEDFGAVTMANVPQFTRRVKSPAIVGIPFERCRMLDVVKEQ